MSQDANTAQSAEMAKQRHEIEDTVQRLIEDLRRAEIIVQQFQGAESQNALFYKINDDIIPKLDKISSMSQSVYQEEIPGQLLRIIDEGKNPDLYTKEMLEECVRRNERTKGKFEAFQKLSDLLHAEAKREFPEQYAVYAQMKQQAPSQN